MVSTLVFVVLVSSQTAHWNMHCCRSLHTDISNLTWRVLYQRHGTQMRCCASLVLNIDHFLSIEPKYKIPVSWQYYWGHLHIFIHKMINFPTDTINFTSAMFIWMEAWSLAPMILLLAELQKRTKYITFTFLWVTSYTLTSTRIVMTNTAFNWAWRTNYASFQLITKVYFPKKWSRWFLSYLCVWIITHHLRGTYRSTNSPASFCMIKVVQVVAYKAEKN